MWVTLPSMLKPSVRSFGLSRQYQEPEQNEEHSLEDWQKKANHSKGDQQPANQQHNDSFDLPFHRYK
jgi:hypothetical protein